MIIVILFSAGAFIIGLLFGILLNEFIRYKFSEDTEYKYEDNKETCNGETEKFESDKIE